MELTPTELSQRAGISVPYASQLMSGSRTSCSLETAMAIYDASGLQFGPLANLTPRDIETQRRLAEKARAA